MRILGVSLTLAWQPPVFDLAVLSEPASNLDLRSALSSAGVIQVPLPADLGVKPTSDTLMSIMDRCSDVQTPFSRVDLPHGERLTLAARDNSQFPSCASETEAIRAAFSRIGDNFASSFIPEQSQHISTLDHLHWYRVDPQEAADAAQDPLVPHHVDKGLFLVMTAAEGLEVDVSGETRPVEVLPGHVLVMVGGALNDFLGKRDMQPCLHGVASVNKSRAVLARMYLLDFQYERNGVTFEEFFTGTLGNERDPVAQGPWRRLMDKQCEADEKMCWHQCMKASGCGVSDAVCWDKKQNVFCNPDVHNSNCGLICPAVNFDSKEEGFCFDGTSMFMDGFQWCLSGGQPCVILLFKRFTLDSRLKFLLGCLAVFILGASVEGVVIVRKNVVSGRRNKRRKLAAAILFGVNLTLAYLIMLVAMTYSIELFFSVILGLVTGHLFWKNEQDAAKYESPEPCCITAPNSTQVTASLAHNCQCA